MNKRIIVLFVLTVFSVAPACSRPLYTTPAIEGTLADATTGRTIEDSIIEVRWLKEVYTPIHPQSYVIKKELITANSGDGRYHIPEETSLHLFSRFSVLALVVRNPFYETKEIIWGTDEFDLMIKGARSQGSKRIDRDAAITYEYRNGIVSFTLRVLPLEEKYKEQTYYGGLHGSLSYEILDDGVAYFRAADELGLDIDQDAVFRKWDELARHLKDYRSLRHAIDEAKKRIEKINKNN